METNSTIKTDKIVTNLVQSGSNTIVSMGGSNEHPSVTTTNEYSKYMNDKNVYNKNVCNVYYTTDSLGNTSEYGSFDNTENIAAFKPLGLSFIVFIFSIYLFYVATKLYHQYFDKELKEKIFDLLFYLCGGLIISFWIGIALSIKGIAIKFLKFEFIDFPNQFVFGVVLSSLLFLSIGIFRFSIVALIHNPVDSEKVISDIRFSFVGFIFGILAIIADLLTIWTAL